MTTNIYVLKLQGGNYYVGKSSDVIGRYQEHMNGNGSAWTKKYRPLSLLESRDNVSSFMEDMVVKEYMAKYGIEKVRGGSYVTEKLSDFHLDALKMEIWTANDCCTNCGRKGHFVKDCHAKTDVSGNSLYVYSCERCDKVFPDEKVCEAHERGCRPVKYSAKSGITCYSCGKTGHYATTCYAARSKYESGSDWASESDWESD
jgi:predicted GIY-YIG superfamily endonuclease